MAADEAEKTEYPTPRRLQRARKEGNVPKTNELNSAIVLLTGTILIYILMKNLIQGFILFFNVLWGEVPTFTFTVDNLQNFTELVFLKLIEMLVPILLGIMVLGVLINIVQSGFLWTTKPLKMHLNRLNPVVGTKRLVSSRGFVEMIKNLLKVSFVGLVAYWTVKADFPQFIPLLDKGTGDIVNFIGVLTFKVALRMSLLILIIGILDYIWVKYKYIKDLKMTKQEVKDEIKQLEGPPEVRRKIRSLQFRKAMQRMMRDIPAADVVITNPTHYAVALKYEQDVMEAPVVIAKGRRLIAEKIEKISAENDIPLMENEQLAQGIFKSVDVGMAIGPEFFTPVAEVLAFVYRMHENRNELVMVNE